MDFFPGAITSLTCQEAGEIARAVRWIMTPEKLKKAIFDELNEGVIDNWHGITKSNIYQLLVEPEIIDLFDVYGNINQYWLVLDEHADDLENSYRIVYDERKNMFGLATKSNVKGNELGFLVGLYGSFLNTLNNMWKIRKLGWTADKWTRFP